MLNAAIIIIINIDQIHVIIYNGIVIIIVVKVNPMQTRASEQRGTGDGEGERLPSCPTRSELTGSCGNGLLLGVEPKVLLADPHTVYIRVLCSSVFCSLE